VYFALARLREDTLRGKAEEGHPPLTRAQLAAILLGSYVLGFWRARQDLNP
jgi:hypothetical protein